MDTDYFQYKALDRRKGDIRLFRLIKRNEGPIEGEIVHTTLAEHICYEAVSYVWGRSDPADTINIGGKRLPITLNLAIFLRDLRSTNTDWMIWVDAICINQSDMAERGHQVKQMKDIYTSAQRVLFCASQPTAMTDVLMASLEELWIQISKDDEMSESDIATTWNGVQSRLTEKYWGLEQQQTTVLKHILSQPWFSRVWVLQEVANARDAILYCGKKSIPASVFAMSPALLKVRQPESQSHQPVLDLMPGLSRNAPGKEIMKDLYSLLVRFLTAEASDDHDRIYALFGLCADTTSQTLPVVDYYKNEDEVLRDTISHICDCDLSSSEPSFSFCHGLQEAVKRLYRGYHIEEQHQTQSSPAKSGWCSRSSLPGLYNGRRSPGSPLLNRGAPPTWHSR
jgi:hypothetical protein